MHAIAPSIRKRHQQQWWALGLALTLLCMALAGWLATQRQTLLAQEAVRLQAQARVVERNLARQLWSTHQLLGELIDELARWRALGQAESANAWLQAMTGIQPGLRTTNVLDAQGRVLASSRPELIGADFRDRDYFQAAWRGRDPALLYLSAPFRTALGVYALNASRVVVNAQGQVTDVVSATLDPDYFSLLLGSVNYADDMWSAVAHDSGALVMTSPPQADLARRHLAIEDSLFSRPLTPGTDGALPMDRVAVNGVPSVMAQHRIQPLNVRADHALVAAVARSEAGVLAGWRRQAGGAAVMSVLLMLSTAAGLTWMQRAERQAAEGLDRLERIAQTAPGVICQFALGPDGRAAMPFATGPLQAYFGVPVSAAPGSADALFGYIAPEHAERVRHAIAESARTQQPFRSEFLIRVPGQPERWLDVHSVPQHRADGSILWTGLVMECTAQHAARESQLALDAAQRANRAKSEFLSRASHELRTPLNAVIGFSSLLLDHPREPLTPAQREQVGYIHDAGQHLLALINDLLDVSAIESGRLQARMQDVPLAALLAEVLATVREQASAAGVQLVLQADAPQLVVHADRVRLKQVLLNLLSNAIKYNHRSGTVTVVMRRTPDGRAEIEVQDTGIGLTDAQRAHLYEPFNRLGAEDSGIAGTGIGLAIAKMLVELMHGELGVDSQPGRGSRFVVRLPTRGEAADAPVAVAPSAPPGSVAADGPALEVLYVEDNAMNAVFVRQLLGLRPQIRLRSAGSGAEALQALRQAVPDLLLVDLHLGDMTGFDLIDRLRADPATTGLRCAALTADALPATRQRALDAGFVDFITKPVDTRQLLQLIDHEAQRRARAG